ncbi:hypothetical protein IGI04_007449 [Brassica rapa subsp. trilocularis]|uniref:Uncharacterized protein n=1 Tax=Brassica rapa subsp. trilocularis TaxID=1813537 RepID=A0ABQ7NM25_BRACM|nr:hypothetical protein IGI04_007449 [Brassica rapa subsp. trilocularis]
MELRRQRSSDYFISACKLHRSNMHVVSYLRKEIREQGATVMTVKASVGSKRYSILASSIDGEATRELMKKLEDCKFHKSFNNYILSPWPPVRHLVLERSKYVVEQLAASRSVLLHSFHDQPAGRLVRYCALGRPRADLLETAVHARQARLDPRDKEPARDMPSLTGDKESAAVQDGTEQTDLFDIFRNKV